MHRLWLYFYQNIQEPMVYKSSVYFLDKITKFMHIRSIYGFLWTLLENQNIILLNKISTTNSTLKVDAVFNHDLQNLKIIESYPFVLKNNIFFLFRSKRTKKNLKFNAKRIKLSEGIPLTIQSIVIVMNTTLKYLCSTSFLCSELWINFIVTYMSKNIQHVHLLGA